MVGRLQEGQEIPISNTDEASVAETPAVGSIANNHTFRSSKMTLQYANHYMFSDIEPYEIVRRISDKTLEIRPMDAEKDDTVALVFHVGGFSAHCSNQRQQKWIITSNASNPTIRIRLGKGGDWKDAHGRKFKLNQKPVKFYDYNF